MPQKGRTPPPRQEHMGKEWPNDLRRLHQGAQKRMREILTTEELRTYEAHIAKTQRAGNSGIPLTPEETAVYDKLRLDPIGDALLATMKQTLDRGNTES